MSMTRERGRQIDRAFEVRLRALFERPNRRGRFLPDGFMARESRHFRVTTLLWGWTIYALQRRRPSVCKDRQATTEAVVYRRFDTHDARAALRAHDLLARLILRGCVRRGEVPPATNKRPPATKKPAATKPAITLEEAIERHNRARPDSPLHLLTDEEQRELFAKVARGEATITWEKGQGPRPTSESDSD